MKRIYSKIYLILNSHLKKSCLYYFLLFLPATLLEMISLGSLPVFLIFINEPQIIIEKMPFINLPNFILELNLIERSIYGSLFLILVFSLKSLYLVFLAYIEKNLTKNLTVYLSSNLLKYYLTRPYSFHLDNNPNKLIQNMADSQRSTGVVLNFLNLIKEILLFISIFIALMLTDPVIITLIISVLLIPILIFRFLLKKKLKYRGTIARNLRIEALKNLSESFSGIKFTKLIKKENVLEKNYINNLSNALGLDLILVFLNKMPKIFLELFSLVIVLLIINYMYYLEKGFEQILPLLSFIVICIVRLIPSTGSMIASLNYFKFNSVSLDTIYNSKINLINENQDLTKKEYLKKIDLKHNQQIILDNISFNYKNNNRVINDFSITINPGDKIGITGTSGDGKTTLIDLILGFLKPTSGTIKYGENSINSIINDWQNIICFVPQNVNLFDDTIENNITYNLDKKPDNNLLQDCIEIAGLKNFINDLPEGLATHIGHLGGRLSGGQVQRIGIARALYRKPKVLFLDEATNALNDELEKEILSRIFSNSEITIIIISHEKSVLKNCQKIISINKGRKSFEGSYQEYINL